jgi:hypothetical protein
VAEQTGRQYDVRTPLPRVTARDRLITDDVLLPGRLSREMCGRVGFSFKSDIEEQWLD